ncbi:hypothetical protein GWK47_039386 [Chionoecetes opilio]|uniref:Uncharacterized protein n=1 Tax=Chionoecetes opilio TaxID=41210 RepID=A0A8J4YCZ1_CHIOP|nr:hypothetical protein GWK47_039386 [Chionoecetes opilio]
MPGLSVALSVGPDSRPAPAAGPHHPASTPIIANGLQRRVLHGRGVLFWLCGGAQRQVPRGGTLHASTCPPGSPTDLSLPPDPANTAHAYLVFRDFRQETRGVYTCVGAGLRGGRRGSPA